MEAPAGAEVGPEFDCVSAGAAGQGGKGAAASGALGTVAPDVAMASEAGLLVLQEEAVPLQAARQLGAVMHQTHSMHSMLPATSTSQGSVLGWDSDSGSHPEPMSSSDSGPESESGLPYEQLQQGVLLEAARQLEALKWVHAHDQMDGAPFWIPKDALMQQGGGSQLPEGARESGDGGSTADTRTDTRTDSSTQNSSGGAQPSALEGSAATAGSTGEEGSAPGTWTLMYEDEEQYAAQYAEQYIGWGYGQQAVRTSGRCFQRIALCLCEGGSGGFLSPNA